MQHHANFRNFVVEYIIVATRQALDNEEEPIYPVLHAFMKKIGLEVSDVYIDQISMKCPRCSCRVKITGLEFDDDVDGKTN